MTGATTQQFAVELDLALRQALTVGDDVHRLVKAAAMEMPDALGAILVGLLVAEQLFREAMAFAERSTEEKEAAAALVNDLWAIIHTGDELA